MSSRQGKNPPADQQLHRPVPALELDIHVTVAGMHAGFLRYHDMRRAAKAMAGIGSDINSNIGNGGVSQHSSILKNGMK